MVGGSEFRVEGVLISTELLVSFSGSFVIFIFRSNIVSISGEVHWQLWSGFVLLKVGVLC